MRGSLWAAPLLTTTAADVGANVDDNVDDGTIETARRRATLADSTGPAKDAETETARVSPRVTVEKSDLGSVRARVSTLEVMAARSSMAMAGESSIRGSAPQQNQRARASNVDAVSGPRQMHLTAKRSRTSLWCSQLPLESSAEAQNTNLRDGLNDDEGGGLGHDDGGHASNYDDNGSNHRATFGRSGNTRQLSLSHQATSLWTTSFGTPIGSSKSVRFRVDPASGGMEDAPTQMLQVATSDDAPPSTNTAAFSIPAGGSTSSTGIKASGRRHSTTSSLWFDNRTSAVSTSKSSPGSSMGVRVLASSISVLPPTLSQSTRGSTTTRLLSRSCTCGGSLWTDVVAPKRSQSMALPSIGRSGTENDLVGPAASGNMQFGGEGVARLRSSAAPRHLRVADGLRQHRLHINRNDSVLSLTALALDKATSDGGALGQPLISSEDLVTFEGCHDLLRGVELHRVLRRLGTIFKDSKGSQSTYDMSNVTTDIDQFLSHNWCVPWWKKFIALACYFNINLSIILTSMLVLVCSSLCILGSCPTVYPQNLKPFPSGYLLRVFAIPFFLFCLAFVRQLTGLLSCGTFGNNMTFLDKVCINQVDPAIQKKGIEKLGAFIAKSREMVVLYTDVYLIKLWTVYEVATHLAMKNVRTMKVVPVFKYGAWVSCLITMYILELLTLFSRTNFPHLKHAKYYIAFVMGFIYMRFVLRKWARLRGKIRGRLRNFSVQECLCFCESDRSLVYSNIALLMEPVMKTEDPEKIITQGEALEAFNLLVRKKLPGRFMSAFGRCTFTYREYVIIGLAAGGTTDFDELGALYGGRPHKKVIVEFIRGLYQLFAIWPMIMIGMEIVCEKCLTWRGWWDTGYTFFGVVALSIPFVVLNETAKKVAMWACDCHPEGSAAHTAVQNGLRCDWDCGKSKLWFLVLVLMAVLLPLVPLSLIMNGCCRCTRRRNLSSHSADPDDDDDNDGDEGEDDDDDDDNSNNNSNHNFGEQNFEASPVFEVEEIAMMSPISEVELTTAIPSDPAVEDDEEMCLGATDDMGNIHSLSPSANGQMIT